MYYRYTSLLKVIIINVLTFQISLFSKTHFFKKITSSVYLECVLLYRNVCIVKMEAWLAKVKGMIGPIGKCLRSWIYKHCVFQFFKLFH